MAKQNLLSGKKPRVLPGGVRNQRFKSQKGVVFSKNKPVSKETVFDRIYRLSKDPRENPHGYSRDFDYERFSVLRLKKPLEMRTYLIEASQRQRIILSAVLSGAEKRVGELLRQKAITPENAGAWNQVIQRLRNDGLK